MEINEILERFGGKEVDVDSMPQYQKWALGYFPTDKTMIDPNVYLTLQLDITEALVNFKQNFASAEGGSFTAYMIWRIVQTMNEIEPFNYRYIKGKWYHLSNPPLFVPVATGKENRFREIILEKSGNKPWIEFAKEYRYEINEALEGRARASGSHDESVYYISTIIGNLPNIQFTSFEPHLHITQTGRCFFYMGKRYQLEGKNFIPFSVSLHHGNVDPYMLDLMLQKLSKKIAQTN